MAVFSLWKHLCEQWGALPPVKPVDDVGSKTFMVTGSNVGLGFEASVNLAQMGPKLLVATSRDTVKCEKTQQCWCQSYDAIFQFGGTNKYPAVLERVAASSTPNPRVAAWPLELDSFEKVSAFADRLDADANGALDALVANAGLYRDEYKQTEDGWEVTLQVNYLSTALLSILLLPHLIRTSTPRSTSRLVIVSSVMHYLGSSNLRGSETWSDVLGTINSRGFGSGADRYTVTKLLEVLFVRELAARLPNPTPVIACTVNPGYCRSSLFRSWETSWYSRWVYHAFRAVMLVRSTEEGSRTLVHPVVAGSEAWAMHGRYLSSCQITEESNFAFSPQGKAFSAKLWDETVEILSRVDGRVRDIATKYLSADV